MADVIVVHGYPGSGKTTQCGQMALEGFDGQYVQHISVAPDTPSPLSNGVSCGALFEALHEPFADELLLIDYYPRYAHQIRDFHAALKANDHTLLGTIDFDVSLATSVERILARGPREGETISSEVLQSLATFEFNRHRQTARMAILALGNLAPVEVIDASSDRETVYSQFSSAIGRLALKNAYDKALLK